MPVSALGSRPSAGRTSRVKVFAQTFPYKAFSCYVVLRCSDATLGPMRQRELAKRLGVAHSNVAYHMKKSDLTDWSRENDPDQTGWRFDPNSRLFYPVTN